MKHFFELRTDGYYRCRQCGWGTAFPEMYDTGQGFEKGGSPLRIMGGSHECGDGDEKFADSPFQPGGFLAE